MYSQFDLQTKHLGPVVNTASKQWDLDFKILVPVLGVLKSFLNTATKVPQRKDFNVTFLHTLAINESFLHEGTCTCSFVKENTYSKISLMYMQIISITTAR